MALSAAAPSAIAAPQNYLQAYVVDDSGWDPDVTLSSATGPVDYGISGSNPPPPLLSGFSNQGDVAGLADFGVLKAQAYASATGTNRQASVLAKTRFSATVNATPTLPGGGPGLTFGDSVSLNVSLRVDGILNSGAAAGDNTGSVNAGADLRIIDPAILLDCGGPDGCITPRLLDFGAGADTRTYGSTGETYNSWNWKLTTRNGLDQIIDYQSDSNSWVVGPGATCLGTICNDIDFDTGILSTTINTTVGASLDILGSLDMFAQGTAAWGGVDGGAYGSADFLDTFGLVITPITEGAELSFDPYIALYDLGGATVPVPAAVWLFGSGLIGLIGVARRRNALPE